MQHMEVSGAVRRFFKSLGFQGLNKTGHVAQRNNKARLCNHCCRGKATSIKYCVCVYYCLSYPVCKAHAPYCHLWPVWLYYIFPYYII